ncbi:hypothetical protein FMM05_00070 [Flavobacterium zepuense]|uniref:Prepilin-type N-terminal cleavage/methylation domain-containing protein n=1 Tax=Flavobacterium zepuense TaxID=2593302 RepID=A0A552V9E2_9FLAO|nr:prepilin-type N-terminal cleavage/methylation domain-containing protein [Flavobacterium zepuense]TRW27081.1 hypothetical protein FMM05_00070 [Flavobacterium zepuense]
MHTAKVKSFTLSEMLVVMIITAIVVGMAFSVLSLVQKQVYIIKRNFDKTTELSLLEQRLWQDFNSHNTLDYHDRKLVALSNTDTVTYSFSENFVLRNMDTIYGNLQIEKLLFNGREVKSGYIDAIGISAEAEIPGYSFFVFSTPDATLNMNKDGF